MSLELDVPGYVECRHQSLACIVNISMMDGVVVIFFLKKRLRLLSSGGGGWVLWGVVGWEGEKKTRQLPRLYYFQQAPFPLSFSINRWVSVGKKQQHLDYFKII